MEAHAARALALLVVAGGCAAGPAEVGVPHQPRADPPSAPPALADVPPKLPAWSWTGPVDPSRAQPQISAVTPSGGSCLAREDARALTISCALHAGDWSRGLKRDHLERASLAASDRTLFVVRYHPFATGASVEALDLASGRTLWTHRLEGCGPVSHSEYFNAVQARAEGRHLAVFGSEIACRYVELVHGEKGATVKQERLPAAR